MIRAIVTDIEGTTSAIDFVHQILFPYAKKHLAEYVNQHQPNQILDQLRQEIEQPTYSQQQLIDVFLAFIEQDKKSPALKQLQGLIWENGYHQGDFKGHVYTDVVPNLTAWKNQEKQLYVYSSGSVHAQKLLFGFSEMGDLTPLFDGYFDTAVGAKRNVQSYQNIAKYIGFEPQEILFLSDIHQELDAAQQAGWQTIQLVRKDADDISKHTQVNSFAEVQP